jgi:alkylation response protein AidB-like acyl-CoA dehydrogenase
MARRGYWGAVLPKEYGGLDLDMISYGLLAEELARGSSSVQCLLTVHTMVSRALLRWGSRQQKEGLLPALASGGLLAAFALSEPNVGSDAKSVETTATPSGDGYVLDGRKRWITSGQLAGLFLVVARCEGQPTAFLVRRGTPGLTVKPIRGMFGSRASMLAELHLDGCRVAKEDVVGRIGFGFSHVASAALDHGRYSVAWGCVGIAQACLEASLEYAGERRQFGACLKDHQLIQQMISGMITNLKAARLLCLQAGYLRDAGDPRAIMETSIAKYFASTAAAKAAGDAVQIHGANGCSGDYPVQRYLRDAKVMEIIEGSSQMQQVTISQYGFQEYAPARPRAGAAGASAA